MAKKAIAKKKRQTTKAAKKPAQPRGPRNFEELIMLVRVWADKFGIAAYGDSRQSNAAVQMIVLQHQGQAGSVGSDVTFELTELKLPNFDEIFTARLTDAVARILHGYRGFSMAQFQKAKRQEAACQALLAAARYRDEAGQRFEAALKNLRE